MKRTLALTLRFSKTAETPDLYFTQRVRTDILIEGRDLASYIDSNGGAQAPVCHELLREINLASKREAKALLTAWEIRAPTYDSHMADQDAIWLRMFGRPRKK